MLFLLLYCRYLIDIIYVHPDLAHGVWVDDAALDPAGQDDDVAASLVGGVEALLHHRQAAADHREGQRSRHPRRVGPHVRVHAQEQRPSRSRYSYLL